MLVRSVYLLDSPEMTSDPFSDILRLTKAEALLTGGFTAGGAWAIRFPARAKIKFSAVVKGSCWVRLDGEPEPAQLHAGDVNLLAEQRGFVLASDLGLPPVDALTLFSGAGKSTAVLGDGGAFAYLGGHVELDPSCGRLLMDVLPPWIHIKSDSPQAKIFRWLMDQLVEEGAAALPGRQLVSAQLTQLLFVQILREHLHDAAESSAGWLKALGDPRIAPALVLMHSDPARAWTLDELSKASAMSRTSFALRFKTVTGVAPVTYLTEWRMRLAEHALREENTSVSELGRTLGYASESAFSNAFKRVTGSSPTAFKRSGPSSDRPLAAR
jgi:AraC-like DNA-binding protein